MSSLSKLAKMTAAQRAQYFADMNAAAEMIVNKEKNTETARAEFVSARETADAELDAAITDAETAHAAKLVTIAETIAGKFSLDVATIRGKSGVTVAPRYQHPTDASKVWTGRGREPLWIAEIGGREKAIDLRPTAPATSVDVAA
jgi:DNA-binding protein H-NS